jgi:hypothetical protein
VIGASTPFFRLQRRSPSVLYSISVRRHRSLCLNILFSAPAFHPFINIYKGRCFIRNLLLALLPIVCANIHLSCLSMTRPFAGRYVRINLSRLLLMTHCEQAEDNSAAHRPFGFSMRNTRHHIAPPSTPVGGNSSTATEFEKVTDALSGLTNCIARLQTYVETLGMGCPTNTTGTKAQNRRMTKSEGRRRRAQGLFEFHVST